MKEVFDLLRQIIQTDTLGIDTSNALHILRATQSIALDQFNNLVKDIKEGTLLREFCECLKKLHYEGAGLYEEISKFFSFTGQNRQRAKVLEIIDLMLI